MEVDPAAQGVETAPATDSEKNRGANKSGRWWKEPKKPVNTLNKNKRLHSTWEKKMNERDKKAAAKLLQDGIREKISQEKQDKVARKKEQEERRKENERKAEIVQVIRKTEKLKRLKKKQLRKVEKRDIN
ncbi:unnamed protein product, partial [Mesorhabditis spiculigera]